MCFFFFSIYLVLLNFEETEVGKYKRTRTAHTYKYDDNIVNEMK